MADASPPALATGVALAEVAVSTGKVAAPVPANQIAPGGGDAGVDASPGAELVIAASPVRPGTSSIITYDATLDFDLNFGGFAVDTSTTQSRKRKIQILATDPDGTVHKRITYIKRNTSAVVDGERKQDPSAIRGKTYLVTWKDGVVAVRRANGKPASEAEVDEVRRDEGQLQSPEMVGRMLAGMRLVEDQPFEVPMALLEKLVTSDFRPQRVLLTYRGKTREGERIDAQGVLLTEAAGMKTFVELKSELLLDATGWCLSANATAQIRVEYNGAVVGSGAGKGTILATPLR